VKLASLFLLAFAVSLDGFGVGMTYGLRKIRFPWWSLAIVTFLSTSMILLAMGLGGLLVKVVSAAGAKWVGSVLLISIGGWAIANVLSQPLHLSHERRILRLELKTMGLVIQILKTPAAADLDRSGSISAGEATILGFALSMDAFGAGLGASLIGYPPLETAAVVSLMSLSFIAFGIRIGYRYAETSLIRRLAYLPGIMLIVLGLSKMLS
jgi:putative sporulation protein YtaF